MEDSKRTYKLLKKNLSSFKMSYNEFLKRYSTHDKLFMEMVDQLDLHLSQFIYINNLGIKMQGVENISFEEDKPDIEDPYLANFFARGPKWVELRLDNGDGITIAKTSWLEKQKGETNE